MTSFKTDLIEGLTYTWNNPSRLWYALWVLVPIFGWLALIGYVKDVTNDIANGRKSELRAFGKFWDNFTNGIIVVLYMIPSILVLMFLHFFPFVGNVIGFLSGFFLLPWLMVNFFVKGTFNSLWEIKKAFNVVTDNVVDYLLTIVKTFLYSVIYVALSFIIIGIPGLLFGRGYFLADFYKRNK